MIVTAIEDYQTHGKKVYLDDIYYFLLYPQEIRRFHITVGQDLPLELVHRIDKEIVIRRGKNKAISLLAKANQTEHSIRISLTKGQYREDIINCIIEQLISYGYIDDLQYAKSFIESKASHYSVKELECKLLQKGVSHDYIQIAFDEILVDESEALRRFLRKKGVTKLPQDSAKRNQLYASCYRKGFRIHMVQQVLCQINYDESCGNNSANT